MGFFCAYYQPAQPPVRMVLALAALASDRTCHLAARAIYPTMEVWPPAPIAPTPAPLSLVLIDPRTSMPEVPSSFRVSSPQGSERVASRRSSRRAKIVVTDATGCPHKGLASSPQRRPRETVCRSHNTSLRSSSIRGGHWSRIKSRICGREGRSARHGTGEVLPPELPPRERPRPERESSQPRRR
jgi:hypothetical protein